MKKIILAALVIIGLAFSSQVMAQPAAGGGLPYVIKDDCSSWTRNNIVCITKATKAVCIGNGSSCVPVSGSYVISDTAYDPTTWDGVTDVSPSKNAVRDKFEALAPGGLLQGIPIVAGGGTTDVITADYTPNITLTDKMLVAFVATGANTTTTPTFNADGLGAKTIVKQGGQALVAGDIPRALYVCLIEYNLANTRWELLNPAFVQTTISGNAATASALAADPAGCAGGQVTTDINAAGVSTCTVWPANTLSILSAADYAAIKVLLALTIGTNVQAWDADLDYLAGFTPTANVKSILTAADYAAIKVLLALTIGTNVQAWDADLDYLAGFTPAANVKSILNAADYAAIKVLLALTIGTDVQAYNEWNGEKKVADDPSTAGWGASEANRIWFNTTDKKRKMWNGEEIILLG